MLFLHVTNGDMAAAGLARSGLRGDVLSWRDVLHDGPVPSDRDLSSFRATRAAFLESRGAPQASLIVEDFAARDARLAGLSAGDEVVLWFEPDLYDQLQLCQILARFADLPADHSPTLTIVPADCFLGPMKPEHFRPLFEARRGIKASDVAQAADVWRAFTAESPARLLDVATALDRHAPARTYDADPQVRLPYLAAALRRQLEEYPSVEQGLSRSEQQLCEALAPGEMVLSKLFHAAHAASESWAWLGDSSFAWYVQRLSECTHPLITHANGTQVLAPSKSGKGFWERSVVLTAVGHDVVRARADAIALNGLDRWIGGVHLTTAHHWRWDGHRHSLTERRNG